MHRHIIFAPFLRPYICVVTYHLYKVTTPVYIYNLKILFIFNFNFYLKKQKKTIENQKLSFDSFESKFEFWTNF